MAPQEIKEVGYIYANNIFAYCKRPGGRVPGSPVVRVNGQDYNDYRVCSLDAQICGYLQSAREHDGLEAKP